MQYKIVLVRPMLKACRYGGCNAVSEDSYCPMHRRTKEKRRISKRRNTHIYNSQSWRRIAANHKIKHPICQYCNAAEADVTDHYIELSDGGSNDERNLVSACHFCHNVKTGQLQKIRSSGKSLFEWYTKNRPAHIDPLYIDPYIQAWHIGTPL